MCKMTIMNMDGSVSVEEVKAQIERLYNLNANISARYIAMKLKVTDKDISFINDEIGSIIKELRNITDKCGID